MTQATERSSYRSGAAIGLVGAGASAMIAVASSVLVARVYGVVVIGEGALTLAPTMALIYLSTVQEQVGLVRALSGLPLRDPRVTGLFGAVYLFSSALTVMVAVPTMVATYFVFAGPVGRPELFLPALVQTAGCVLFTNTFWNLDMVFAAFRAARTLLWVRIGQAVAFIAVAVSVGLASPTVWGLVAATLASSFFGVCHRLVAIRSVMRLRVSRTELRTGLSELPEILRFGVRVAPGCVANGLGTESSTWIIGTLAPVAAVGAFSRATQIVVRLGDAETRVSEMLFSTLVERRTNGDREGFERALIDSVRYGMIGTFLLAACLGGASEGVMSIFGGGFGAAATALALLLVGFSFGSASTFQTLALQALGRPWQGSLAAFVRLGVVLPAAVLLTYAYGISGTATAILLGQVAAAVFLGLALRNDLSHVSARLWPLREMVALLCAYFAGLVVARYLDVAFSSVAGVLLAVSTGGAAFLAVLVLGGGVNQRDRARLAIISGRLRRPRRALLSRVVR